MIFSMRLLNLLKDKNSNKSKVIRNVLWALLGKFTNMFGMLFVGILVARYLGPEQYGLMNYVISFVALFSVFAGFGLSNIEVRELSAHPEKKESILGTCLAIRLFFAIVVFFIICLIVKISAKDSFTSVLIITYSSVLFSSCFEVIRNYFSSIIKNEYVVKSEICRTVIGAILKIALLWFKFPLEWFVLATAFDTYLVASGYILSYKKEVGSLRKWSFDKTLVPYLLSQAFPLVLSGAAVVVYERIDQVLIGDLLNNKEVGYFATADKFLGIILFLPGIMMQTIVPILVQSYQRSYTEYIEKSKQAISIIVWISIILSLGVSFCSYLLIKYTYGNEYLAAVPVLQILAWKTVGMGLSGAGGQLIIIERIQKWAVIRNIIGCLTCVGLNLLIIPIFGIVGSAIVTIITVLVSGCFANLLIPPYWHIFRLEIYAIIKGWKHLYEIKYLLK